ncbi:MAG: hypothetical protein GF330_04360 [Candidatus Eisenbacteria bacterium]|nr:hypothetical protein [Candidatus Eisenbacteria bacterium]
MQTGHSHHRGRGPRGRLPIGLALSLVVTLGAAWLLGGCYEHKRGNPVDAFHYDHFVSVTSDHSHISVMTYVNRTQWRVGFRREDLYDGNRDGKLETPGMDRVQITEYVDVEDPPENAVRRDGDIRDYDDLFQRLIGEIRAGKAEVTIQQREYEVRYL